MAIGSELCIFFMKKTLYLDETIRCKALDDLFYIKVFFKLAHERGIAQFSVVYPKNWLAFVNPVQPPHQLETVSSTTSPVFITKSDIYGNL